MGIGSSRIDHHGATSNFAGAVLNCTSLSRISKCELIFLIKKRLRSPDMNVKFLDISRENG